MTGDFAVAFFGLGRFGLDPKVLESAIEPRIKVLPRAKFPDEVMWKVGWYRVVGKKKEKYGVESGTWPGMGPLEGKKGKEERLVLLDTETVFALAVYLGFQPEREMKDCSPLSKQLLHCWRRYVRGPGNEAAFLAKGREAARKIAGFCVCVDLSTVVPPDPERLQFRWLLTNEKGKYVQWTGPPDFRPWWRYCSVMRAPWFNDDEVDKMEVQWGLLCKTCAHPDKRWGRNSPLRTPDGHYCEYTVESFRRHLERRGAVVDGCHFFDLVVPEVT